MITPPPHTHITNKSTHLTQCLTVSGFLTCAFVRFGDFQEEIIPVTASFYVRELVADHLAVTVRECLEAARNKVVTTVVHSK